MFLGALRLARALSALVPQALLQLVTTRGPSNTELFLLGHDETFAGIVRDDLRDQCRVSCLAPAFLLRRALQASGL